MTPTLPPDTIPAGDAQHLIDGQPVDGWTLVRLEVDDVTTRPCSYYRVIVRGDE